MSWFLDGSDHGKPTPAGDGSGTCGVVVVMRRPEGAAHPERGADGIPTLDILCGLPTLT
ncbi:hypothetical protein BN12_2040001 [Nostocoides japonicum T1-X7]|uniref:Uncharacterized protein n=1 Tax=Nostocoides japonicum T1-X7 TaxID=1194083 RepID=A0A077LV82_9MICO|nr:hypothetical protein BN12_2040001 [Tetrasphaera japonica T1-X7]